MERKARRKGSNYDWGWRAWSEARYETVIGAGLACVDEALEAELGLSTERTLLVVIEGAKGPRKAAIETFGERALIQPCREHKKCNVTDALP